MKKFLTLCVCGLTAASLLTGCSNQASAETANGVTSGAETTAETTAAADSAETAAPLETVDLEGIDNGTITLGKYKGVEVTKEAAEVTDEEVDAQVKAALDYNPDYEEIRGRGVQDGDVVNIDYIGTKDGVAFEGGTASGFDFVVGETNFIDGFKDGMMGAKTGDELKLNLTFPEEYPNSPDLAGQAVVFTVTINSIKVEKPAQLDDAFVQRVSEFTTVDEYKADIRQGLLASKESEAEAKLQSDVLEAVIGDSQITANQEAIDANYNNMVINYTNQAAMYGLDLNTLASVMYGMDEAGFKDALKEMAESAVQQRLVFTSVAEMEQIAITDEDREKLAVEMGYEDAKTMIGQVGQYTVDDYLISTKAMDFLVANAVIH